MAARLAPAGALKKYTGGLQVISSGLGRTGTSSLKKALELLYKDGGGKCYHMTEVIEGGGAFGHFDFWVSAAKSELNAEDFRKHFDAYACSTDYPACSRWKELLAAFPDAKVIHTTRSAESWATSALETIFQNASDNPSMPWGIRLIQLLFPFKVGRPMARWSNAQLGATFKGDYSHANLVRHFNAWQASVLAECPKDKLLVFQATDGWEPLCKFLGKPVPAVPYPRVNDTKEFKKILMAISVVGWVTAGLYGVGAAFLGKKLVKHFR